MQFNTDNKNYTYSCYYIETFIEDNNIDLYNALSEAKIYVNNTTISSPYPQIGDYLLIKNFMSSGAEFHLYKYTDSSKIGNERFIDSGVNYSGFYCYIIFGIQSYATTRTILYISNDVSVTDGTFGTEYKDLTFTGKSGEIDPIDEDNELYLNITTGIMYKYRKEYYNNHWAEVVTGLPKLLYISNNNNSKYVVYTEFNGLGKTVKICNFIKNDYQGYYNPDIILSGTDITSIKNEIKRLKLNNDVFIGDTLLCKYSFTKYCIYTLNTINTITTININTDILFYDLSSLNVFMLNSDGPNSQYIFGIIADYFNQLITVFNFNYSNNLPTNNNNIGDEYYIFTNELIYTYTLNSWVVTNKCINKFNYTSMSNNKDLLGYLNYDNFKIVLIDKYEGSNMISIYQGYYFENQTITNETDINILSLLQYNKQNFINIWDTLLVNVNNIMKIYLINIIGNQVDIKKPQFGDINFFYITNNLINNINILTTETSTTNLNVNQYIINGIIKSEEPNNDDGVDGNIYLNISEPQIYYNNYYK